MPYAWRSGIMLMEIADLRCEGCGIPDILAIAPGDATEEAGQFLLLRGTPTKAWCLACWLRLHGIRPPREIKPVQREKWRGGSGIRAKKKGPHPADPL